MIAKSSGLSGPGPDLTETEGKGGEFNFAVIYLIRRLIYRLVEFLRHWYVKSVKIYSDAFFNLLSRLDYDLAWRITLSHLFEPLYKDYSIVGYILGFFFRAGRLVFASVIYLIIFAAAILFYLIWLLAIPGLVYFIFK